MANTRVIVAIPIIAGGVIIIWVISIIVIIRIINRGAGAKTYNYKANNTQCEHTGSGENFRFHLSVFRIKIGYKATNDY